MSFKIERLTFWVVELVELRASLPCYRMHAHFKTEESVQLFVSRWIMNWYSRGCMTVNKEPYWFIKLSDVFVSNAPIILRTRQLTDNEIIRDIKLLDSKTVDTDLQDLYEWYPEAIELFRGYL